MKKEKIKLGIYVVSTLNHAYALEAQARALHSACLYADIIEPNIVIVSSCENYFDELEQLYRDLFSKINIKVIKREEFFDSSKRKPYKNDIQLMISQMRTIATRELLSYGCNRVLSMDSDVIPKHNSIQCMLDMLNFDHGYYDVVQCPYPSQGGGAFLGGRGTIERQILPDFSEDERQIPKEVLREKKEAEKDLRDFMSDLHKEKAEKSLEIDKKIAKKQEKIRDLSKEIEEYPPKNNVFALNGKKWKKRGWFDYAYPAIGKGSVVPVDWVGFGCTMMSKKAALLCDWTGYCGGGTEDLYIIWNRWHHNNINIANIAHCPSDHIIRNTEKELDGKYRHIKTSHELAGEYIWHLRQENIPWYSQKAGEVFLQKEEEKEKKAKKKKTSLLKDEK